MEKCQSGGMNKIKLLIMDVDGTLTDGKIYMGQTGEILKAFNIKDGCGIKLILPKNNIIPAIITARKSKILENRCMEMGIKELYQDCFDKQNAVLEITKKLGIGLDGTAYIGDDLPDIPCMKLIKENGGVIMAPTDAIPEIKALADFVAGNKAGEGAIRECINYLIVPHDNKNVSEAIQSVIDWIAKGGFKGTTEGKGPGGCRYAIQEYDTMDESSCIIESHRHNIDIQYVLKGTEILKTYVPESLLNRKSYNEEKDVDVWEYATEATQSYLIPGSLIIIRNGEPHKGAIANKTTGKVKKLVCKIEV